MGKKAKRRGRPPGSKNKKKSLSGAPARLRRMDVAELKSHISRLGNLLTAKVAEQRQMLERQLAELQRYVSSTPASAIRTVKRVPRRGTRLKPKPKYQSKKHKGLKWTGRGMLPRWMREEMRGTKLTKEHFLIKA